MVSGFCLTSIIKRDVAVKESKVIYHEIFDPYARKQDSDISQIKRIFSSWSPMFGELKSDFSHFLF